MKKILTGIITGASILGGLLACQNKVDELYLNPEKTTEVSMGKFFTKILDNDRVRPSYWNVRTFLAPHAGVYTQSVSFTNSNKRYMQQLSYTSDFWRDYYTPAGSGIVSHMREMERIYASLSASEKTNADVYMMAARIVYYDQTSQMIDLWGDIPFSEAGLLNLSGDLAAPKFDDAEEVYNTLLAGLETSADYFKNTAADPTVKLTFSKQDLLLKGNFDLWTRYANSIRLRLLMRISFKNESKAQTDVMKMLNNVTSYPLVDEAAYNVILTPLTTYADNMNNALLEASAHIAPEFLLDKVLKPANDPRIRVLFDKGVDSDGVYNADYYSLPSGIPLSDQETNITHGKYALLDSATFRFNKAFPGIIITSAEVNFLKAEAYQRWGSTIDAQTAYEKGVTHAVKFVFGLNQSSSNGPFAANVTPAEISDLLVTGSVAFAGTSDEKLAKIWIQKWLNFGFIQSIQSWAELRRTKYPVLTFVTDNSPGAPGTDLPPSRLLYPSNEKTYNAANYAKVATQDIVTSKIFWDVK